MIGRQVALLLVLCTSTTCHALKGARGSLRLLQGQPPDVLPPTTPLEVKDVFEDPKGNTTIVDKNGAAKKEDKKEDKKDKKDKKCKKREKKDKKGDVSDAPAETPTEGAPTTAESVPNGILGPPQGAEQINTTDSTPPPGPNGTGPLSGGPPLPPDDEFVPWCEDPSIKAMGDCPQLKNDVFPKGENAVDGKLELEVTSTQPDLVKGIERVLKEDTTLSAIGCDGRRLQQDNETGMNVTVYLLAFEIGDASQSSQSK